MDYLAKARRVIALEMSEVERLHARLDESFERAVETLLRCVEGRGKIVVCGVGKSGHIGEKIAATLTSTGSPAVVLNSLNALHGDLGVVADGDVVLALSASGETDELVNILPALARFDVQIIAMTGNAKSFLAQQSHVHLDVSVEQEACPLNLAPTSSTTVMLVLGDALAMVRARGARLYQGRLCALPSGRPARAHAAAESPPDHARRGADGDRRGVREHPRSAARDGARARRRGGGRSTRMGGSQGSSRTAISAGIFRRIRICSRKPSGEFMTRQPITIRGDKLAVEVLHVLERHRIDDLVVLDADERPIGVVDSQDLARFKLV